MAEADLAALDPDHGAGHGDLAEIEGRAAAADPAAGHDEARLGPANGLEGRRIGKASRAARQFVDAGRGEHRERGAPNLRRLSIAVIEDLSAGKTFVRIRVAGRVAALP